MKLVYMDYTDGRFWGSLRHSGTRKRAWHCATPVFSTVFELRGRMYRFFHAREKVLKKNGGGFKKMFYLLLLKFDGLYIFMAYGVILKHLEVDKITWGSFSNKRGVGKRGGVPFF
jgi:hypothetical protein